jgi:hypothetical protein
LVIVLPVQLFFTLPIGASSAPDVIGLHVDTDT